ncbi:MAG: hypothetical protein K8J31_00225 [Anaerolineae bacterium]|nr:hypothetical protein [Anaerolineae bacterium]
MSSTATPTVQVEYLPTYNALKMTWRSPIDRADIQKALSVLMSALETMNEPTYVVVELTGDIRIPVGLTVSETLLLPYQHPMLAELLVYGASAPTRAIGRTLSLLTGHEHVRGFESEAAVFHHLNTLKPL